MTGPIPRSSDPKDKVLYVENVCKAYGGKVVLDDVDLSVRSGEFCGVVGPSGCGKSTLLRLILGAEEPTSGRILLDNEPVGPPDPKRGIVYQKYSLFPHLTVLDNVLLGKRLTLDFAFRRQAAALTEEAMALLKQMRLEGDAAKYPHQLSGGMQQRVAIAQAMVMRPSILLMDEPFGALDPGTREDMQVHLLEAWEKSKMTVFFVTHDLPEAVYLATRVLVLTQFYRDERGDGYPGRGAKVVGDYDVAHLSGSTDLKRRAEYADLVQTIRQDGFEPEARRHVNDFNLKHPDSWRSLRPEESGG
ncbi:MAG: ABC transporter ATP-binding protein [Elusimicrobia bacterium]|nr:ABC transporter ATP-binding protein [Elusimicrobiota bacterium]